MWERNMDELKGSIESKLRSDEIGTQISNHNE